jgi:hypothetical protein
MSTEIPFLQRLAGWFLNKISSARRHYHRLQSLPAKSLAISLCWRHFEKEREHLANLFLARLMSVFSDLKSFRVLNDGRLRTIPLLQSLPPLRLQLSRC